MASAPAADEDQKARAWLRSARSRADKRISALVRVKNEEEFLDASIRSIVEHVDEVVIIDNASSDATPEIARSLQGAYPDKIVLRHYPHEVRKIGSENRRLASSAEGNLSPQLSANFYNWGLAQCRFEYAFKWDGDMVAADRLLEGLARWRRGDRQALIIHGANLHPDRRSLIASRITERQKLVEQLGSEDLPLWVTSLGSDHPEPRLFPKFMAEYRCVNGWTQSLVSPFLRRPLKSEAAGEIEEPCYLHLKFCKANPFAAYSEDLASVIAGNAKKGPALEPELLRAVERWGL